MPFNLFNLFNFNIYVCYALRVMRQKWRLLKCSRVNPYVRIRFLYSCVSEKLNRSMSRFMRHPIEKQRVILK